MGRRTGPRRVNERMLLTPRDMCGFMRNIRLKILMEAWENSEEIKLVDAGPERGEWFRTFARDGNEIGYALDTLKMRQERWGRGLGRVGRLLL
jgi:hypothetical protein